MRFRNIFMIEGAILTSLILIITDPSARLITDLRYGTELTTVISSLVVAHFFIALLHFARKALFDYLNLEELFLKAKETSEGAGFALIGIGLFSISIALVIMAATK